MRRIATAGFIGTAIEFYDYYIYGTVAALVLNEAFFPELSESAGTLATLSTFAVGFAARPPAGRRGVRPLRRPRGPQGRPGRIAADDGPVDGPDRAPARIRHPRRGGTDPLVLLFAATFTFLLMSSALDDEAFAFVLVAVGLVIRLKIAETPAFAKVTAQRETAKAPLAEAFRKHPKEMLLGAGMITVVYVMFYTVMVWACPPTPSHAGRTGSAAAGSSSAARHSASCGTPSSSL